MTAIFSLFLIFQTGCLPQSSTDVGWPTETPAPSSETPTPTIVWFPPTVTATHLQAVTQKSIPTPEPLPEHGEVIYSDDFSDSTHWKTGNLPEGRISLGVNELSLAVSSPRGYLFSLLQGFSQADFYLEITANPTICRGNDEFGVLLRASSLQDFFRFALTCDGRARIDRVLKGQASASIPPVLSGAIPPGAPSRSRLGIWAKGKELRFYANGQYLFDLKDPSLPEGSLGLFARAGDEDSMSVNFSELVIYALAE